MLFFTFDFNPVHAPSSVESDAWPPSRSSIRWCARASCSASESGLGVSAAWEVLRSGEDDVAVVGEAEASGGVGVVGLGAEGGGGEGEKGTGKMGFVDEEGSELMSRRRWVVASLRQRRRDMSKFGGESDAGG